MVAAVGRASEEPTAVRRKATPFSSPPSWRARGWRVQIREGGNFSMLSQPEALTRLLLTLR